MDILIYEAHMHAGILHLICAYERWLISEQAL